MTVIVPSHDLVVARLGHYRGGGPGFESFRKALALLDGGGAEEQVMGDE